MNRVVHFLVRQRIAPAGGPSPPRITRAGGGDFLRQGLIQIRPTARYHRGHARIHPPLPALRFHGR
jgi:hypothetical protein